MGITAARLGIIYGPDACRALLEQVGLANAKRILFSGQIFPAEACRDFGLIDRLAPDSALDGAKALAREFLASAPLTVGGTKRILNALARGEERELGGEIQALIDQAFNSEDYREGQRAFKEKRRPQFRGR